MPFEVFTPGVLTSAVVNAYLMNQVVIVCTSGTRPTSPVVGMTLYETDTNRYVMYTGAAWQTLLDNGVPTLDTGFSVDGMAGAYVRTGRVTRIGKTLLVSGKVTFTGASVSQVYAYSFLSGTTIGTYDSTDYAVGVCNFSGISGAGTVFVDNATAKLKFQFGAFGNYLGNGSAVANGNVLQFSANVPIT